LRAGKLPCRGRGTDIKRIDARWDFAQQGQRVRAAVEGRVVWHCLSLTSVNSLISTSYRHSRATNVFGNLGIKAITPLEVHRCVNLQVSLSGIAVS
jgi:hypothetical protein